jgi:hypothetical protein
LKPNIWELIVYFSGFNLIFFIIFISFLIYKRKNLFRYCFATVPTSCAIVLPRTTYDPTAAPAAIVSTTYDPTTAAPAVIAPTTYDPTTAAPAAIIPTTYDPTTAAPTAIVPTTYDPTATAAAAAATITPTTYDTTATAAATIDPSICLIATGYCFHISWKYVCYSVWCLSFEWSPSCTRKCRVEEENSRTWEGHGKSYWNEANLSIPKYWLLIHFVKKAAFKSAHPTCIHPTCLSRDDENYFSAKKEIETFLSTTITNEDSKKAALQILDVLSTLITLLDLQENSLLTLWK